jgi:hypothetical protein
VRSSGDGTKVVFTTTATYMVDSDGSNLRLLDLPRAENIGGRIGSLNSDGSRIAYQCVSQSGTSIDSWCVVSTEGTGTEGRDFHVFPTQFGDPLLSGDGRLMGNSTGVFKTDGTGFQALDQRVVFGAPGHSITFDGSVLCYAASIVFVGVDDIYCIKTDATALFNLTSPPGGANSYSPGISDNGAVVVFVSSADLDPPNNPDGQRRIFSALLRPSLSIDGAAASDRPRGETFALGGFGFTPGRPVMRRVRQPNGVEVTLEPLNATTDGRISWAFPTDANTPTGTYLIWVIDEDTGRISNIVRETIIAQQ